MGPMYVLNGLPGLYIQTLATWKQVIFNSHKVPRERSINLYRARKQHLKDFHSRRRWHDSVFVDMLLCRCELIVTWRKISFLFAVVANKRGGAVAITPGLCCAEVYTAWAYDAERGHLQTRGKVQTVINNFQSGHRLEFSGHVWRGSGHRRLLTRQGC